MSDLHRKISEYEGKIVQLSQEVDRLTNLLNKYEKDKGVLGERER